MATEKSGGPHLPPSWPEVPQREAPPSWPEATRPSEPPRQDVPTSWPEAPQPSWPEPSRQEPTWPDPQRTTSPDGWSDPQRTTSPDGWSDPQRTTSPDGWSDPQRTTSPDGWSDPQRTPPPDAWPEPQNTTSPDAWSNLSSPAPWPQVTQPGGPLDRPASHNQGVPADAYAMSETPLDDRPRPRPTQDQQVYPAPPQDHQVFPAPPQDHQVYPNPPQDQQVFPGTPLDDRAVPSGGTPHPPMDDQARPGANLSRDPSDPDRPFVTAGQISGSRTPPPERQQELWDTVFGDNYQAMGEQDDSLDEPGRPIWMYALAGSVAIALVGALAWAFLAGPLASDEPAANQPPAKANTSAPPPPTKSSTSIGRLPRYPGKAAPVTGALPDAAARISVPRLGGTWQLDQRATVKTTYGYDTRQFAKVGENSYAQLMTGPLPSKLASSFTSEDDLEPVIRQVVLSARKRFFPEDNKVRKIAQQPIKVGQSTGRLVAYSLTSGTENATIVTAAVNSGGDVPAIVYMSVPADGKQYLPDINTVVKQLKVVGQP
ncbi:hypothetical protein ABT294_32485 [Nonomuraea sp. NPDC000554]|uniref:hypothetical protein n=1 Tax=Nonomuraea sp. NPDC000554 TaxID=3154259 RepID=UPI00332D14E8